MNVCMYGDSLDCFTVAAILADYGNRILLKSNEKLIDSNDLFESEPGLKRRFEKNIEARRILVSQSDNDTVSNAFKEDVDIHWIFSRNQDSHCYELIQSILEANRKQTFFISSHHNIGFYKEITSQINYYCTQKKFEKPIIVLIPFMSREGSAISDFENPELLIAGTDDREGFVAVYELMGPFIRQAKKFMAVSAETAEMIRSASSAMLATRLSFMNEVALLCDEVGVDIEVVRQAMASDSRIGPQYLSPGCGFGGVTLQKELENLQSQFRSGGAGTRLLDAVLQTNKVQKEYLFCKFWQYYGADIEGKTVAIWGGAFKAGVSSTENSAIHELLPAFWAQNVKTRVYEPKAHARLSAKYANQPLFELIDDQYLALKDVDALLIVTDHKQFFSPNFHVVKSMMRKPVIFDGRNIFDIELVESKGIEYFGIGHGRSIN